MSCLCLLLGGALPAIAQQEDDSEQVTLYTLSPEEKEVLRKQVLEPVPAGASQEQLEAFFQSRKMLSEQQGDLAASEQFSRNWLAALPNDWEAHWRMAQVQQLLGSFAEYFVYAKNATRLAPNSARRAYVQAMMGLKYLQLQANEKDARLSMAAAEASLEELRRQVGRGKNGNGQYRLARTEAGVYRAKSTMESFTSQYDSAASTAIKAVAAAQRSVALAGESTDKRNFFARNELLQALAREARAHSARGALFDAGQSIRQGLDIIARGDVSVNVTSAFFSSIGNLYVQEGRFREAEQWARKGVDSMTKAGVPPASTPLLSARIVEETALAGQERWGDAWRKFEEVDGGVQGNAEAQQFASNALTRAIVLLKLRRWPEAEATLTPLWQKQANLFGAAHATPALTEGLLAWAKWENGKRSEGLAHFDSALPALMADALGAAEREDQGLVRLIRKSIAEAYLQALGSKADAHGLERGFTMAGWLSGSSVQQALSDAAQRTRFADPQLQAAVRGEQDTQRELDVLYRYVNQQTSEDGASRTPAIAEQMRQRIAQLVAQRQQQHMLLRKSFPQYEQMVRPRPPTPQEIAARLDDDEVFVQLLTTSRGSYVWAVDRQHGVAGMHSELDEAAVAGLVLRMRSTLDVAARGAQAPAFDFTAANKLYEALIKPLTNAIGGKKHLIFSTSSPLAQIPFAALVTAPYNGDPASAPWLIRQAAISHTPGAGAWMALKQLSQTKAAPEAVMGWGDPVFDRRRVAQSGGTRTVQITRAASNDATGNPITYAQIPPLPETRAEVEAISDMLRGNRQQDLRFGIEASRENVMQASQSGQLAQKRVVVFATHGLVPGDLPNLRQPALAMAASGAETADPLAPLLTLEDVLSLKLNADWVVLSACNTAAADGKAEEALSGLARGFFYAGSRSLLVTHWAVESESASLLTTGTFAHQTAHPGDRRAESLRDAMLKVMVQPKFAHPAFWAPYALVGEGGR